MKKRYHPTDLNQEAENLLNYRNKMLQMYACEHGENFNKHLYISGTGTYVVHLNGELVLETVQAYTAVEKYFNL